MAWIHQMNDFLKELGKQRLDNETRLFLAQFQQKMNGVMLNPWLSDMQKAIFCWENACYVQNFLRNQAVMRQGLECFGLLNKVDDWLNG